MSKTDWQEVLDWMYRNDVINDAANEYYSVEDIREQIVEREQDFDKEQVSEALSVLSTYELIEDMEVGDINYPGLSRDGIYLGHEREQSRIQTRTSLAIAYLTLGLMATGLTNAIVTATSSVNALPIVTYGWLTFGIVITLIVGNRVKSLGLLKRP